jgi:hypothetical protein
MGGGQAGLLCVRYAYDQQVASACARSASGKNDTHFTIDVDSFNEDTSNFTAGLILEDISYNSQYTQGLHVMQTNFGKPSSYAVLNLPTPGEHMSFNTSNLGEVIQQGFGMQIIDILLCRMLVPRPRGHLGHTAALQVSNRTEGALLMLPGTATIR